MISYGVLSSLCLSYSLFLDIGLLESQPFLLIHDLQNKSEDEGCHSETCKHNQGSRVVVLRGVCDTGISLVKHLSNEQREEPKADVLNPKDECIGRTDHLGVHEFRHAGPQ